MPRSLKIASTVLILVTLLGAPLAYLSYRKANFRNFRVVEEGILYRSGQLTPTGLERVFYDHGINTVVSMREGDKDLDHDEEVMCAKLGVKFVRLPPLSWGETKDGIPAQKNVDAFIDVMKDRKNYPVLVHCWAGIHRTGQMCAIYRVEFDGWPMEKAVAEMKGLGYTVEHLDVMDYLANYQPRRPQIILTGRTRDDLSQLYGAP